jgi:hypothetical protein
MPRRDLNFNGFLSRFHQGHVDSEGVIMRSGYGLCAGGVLATLLMALPVRGDDKLADLMVPYSPVNIEGALRDEQIKKELKITKDQVAAIKKIVEKSSKRSSGDGDKIYKMPKTPDKYQKIHALTALRADQLFKDLGTTLSTSQIRRLKQIMLQLQGITIVDCQEIRTQLELGEADVTRLHAAYDRRKKQIQKQALDHKTTIEQANEKLKALDKWIPEGISDALNEQQQLTLNKMLGEKYIVRK